MGVGIRLVLLVVFADDPVVIPSVNDDDLYPTWIVLVKQRVNDAVVPILGFRTYPRKRLIADENSLVLTRELA